MECQEELTTVGLEIGTNQGTNEKQTSKARAFHESQFNVGLSTMSKLRESDFIHDCRWL